MDETIKKTSIEGLLEIQRPTFADGRGFFRESARIREIEEATGIKFNVVQMNHARSIKNTLRGIHAAPWNKLVYVTSGKVKVVVVDLRPESPTFGKHEAFMIGDESKSSIFIPKGLGNSYLVLSEEADYTYLTDEEWSAGRETSVAWDDPDLAIDWQIPGEAVISEKDKNNPSLRSVFPDKF